jgi:penicillin-binding protein 1A
MNIKQTPQSNNKRPKKKNLRKIIIITASILLIAFIMFMLYVIEGLPSLEKLERPRAQLASNVWSRDGVLIGQFYNENRVEVSIDSIPPVVVQALVATEDKSFFKHWGVDLQRTLQAVVKNVVLLKREGASTITQQLAKNLYSLKIKHETIFDTFVRKVREWITAVQIEKTYTKKEILEMYFNISWFGHGAYGISTAARTYFDKNVKDLNVTDAGVLVALLKSAVNYDPFDHYENALRRRNLVMQNMVDEEFLREEDFDKYKLQPIKLSYKRIEEGVRGSLAPHFLEYIRQQMQKISNKYGYNLYQDGLNIYTSLDSRMQKIANNAVQLHLNEFQKQFDKYWNWNKYPQVLNDMIDKAIRNSFQYKKAINDADKRSIYVKLQNDPHFIDSVKQIGKRIEVGFVCIDPKNGEIRALVGGRDQVFSYGLNHVTQIKRQAGSSFKPIVYAVALQNGLYPAYPILNQPFNYNGWSPANFDHSTGGFTTLRYALQESINIVAGRLIIEGHAPLWQIGRLAEKMGVKSKLDLYPSISLGTSVVSPLELTSAYATLANHGIYNEPISILRIEDKDNVLLENFTSSASEAVPEETNYILTDMLRTAIDAGTGASSRSLYKFTRPAAGKTGTTQDYADAWYMGYTPQLAAGVWVGFDDQRVSFTGTYGQGARAALPIWAVFMRDAHDQLKLPVEDFIPPASGKVVYAKFCKESIYEGHPKLYSSGCSGGVITDLINKKDFPNAYDAFSDTSTHFNDFYQMRKDSAHNNSR